MVNEIAYKNTSGEGEGNVIIHLLFFLLIELTFWNWSILSCHTSSEVLSGDTLKARQIHGDKSLSQFADFFFGRVEALGPKVSSYACTCWPMNQEYRSQVFILFVFFVI